MDNMNNVAAVNPDGTLATDRDLLNRMRENRDEIVQAYQKALWEIDALRTELQGIGVEQYYTLQAKCREQAGEIRSLRAELGRWKEEALLQARLYLEKQKRAYKAERERDEARQANAVILQGCRAIYHDMQHKETLEYNETNPKEFVSIIVNTLGLLLTQYDTAPKEDKTNE